MEREKGLARGAEGSVSTLSNQLEEALKEISKKEAASTELRSRLEEVQVWESGERLVTEYIFPTDWWLFTVFAFLLPLCRIFGRAGYAQNASEVRHCYC